MARSAGVFLTEDLDWVDWRQVSREVCRCGDRRGETGEITGREMEIMTM